MRSLAYRRQLSAMPVALRVPPHPAPGLPRPLPEAPLRVQGGWSPCGASEAGTFTQSLCFTEGGRDRSHHQHFRRPEPGEWAPSQLAVHRQHCIAPRPSGGWQDLPKVPTEELQQPGQRKGQEEGGRQPVSRLAHLPSTSSDLPSIRPITYARHPATRLSSPFPG